MMSSCTLILWIICFLATNVALALFGASGSSLVWDDNGGDNPYLNVSQTLRLTCNVARGEPVNNIHFVYPNNSAISETYVTTVTTNIYKLILPDMQVEDAGIYLCVRGDGTVLDSQSVRVEYPLQPVLSENFRCEVFNWESMTCRWSLGVNYANPEHINVTLVYVVSGVTHAQQADCPQIENTSCTWPKGTFLTNMNTYLMCVIVKNNKTNEEVKSTILTIESRKYVRPAKVDTITVRSRNNTCLHFNWTHRMEFRRKIYMLKVTDASNPYKTKVINTTNESELVCDLEPYTLYNVSISCKPQKDGDWSDEFMIHAITEQDVPRIGPPLTSGSYFQRRCENDNPDCRKVIIYWKPLQNNDKNGQILGYRVQYSDYDGPKKTVTVDGEDSNYVILEMSQKRSYQISLQASTSVGFSTKASTIFIPKEQEGISLPKNLLVQALVNSSDPNITINMSWSAPSSSGYLQSYTVYWCPRDEPSTYTCQGKLEWKIISAHESRAQIRLPREDFEYNYLFGISADKNAVSSSGLVWSNCTYQYGQLPQVAPHGLRFAEHNEDNSLHIEWDHYLCHESGFVISYMVYFCPVNNENQCTGHIQNHSVSNKFSKYRISNLKDDIKYAVWLRAVTETGYGPETDKIVKTAINTQLKAGAIAGIAIAAVCVVLMAIIGVVVSLRYIDRKRKRLLKGPEFIVPPPLPDIDFDTSSNRHNSGGSGYNHLPPSPTSQTPFISDDSTSQRSSMVGTDTSQRSSRYLNDSFLRTPLPSGVSVFSMDKNNRLYLTKNQSKNQQQPESGTRVQGKQQTWPLATQGMLLLNPPEDNRGYVSLPINGHLPKQGKDVSTLPVGRPHEATSSESQNSQDGNPGTHIDSYSAFAKTDSNSAREDLTREPPHQTCDNFGYVKESDVQTSAVPVDGERNRVVRMEPSLSDYVMADSYGIHYPHSSVSSSSSLPYISRENSLTSMLHAYPGACRCSGGRGPRVKKQRPRINTNGSLLRACMDPDTSDTSLSSLEQLKCARLMGNQIPERVSEGRQNVKDNLPYNSNMLDCRDSDYVPHHCLHESCSVDSASHCAHSDYLQGVRTDGPVVNQTGLPPAFQHGVDTSETHQAAVTSIPIPEHDEYDGGYIGLPTMKELAQSCTSVDDGICDSSGMVPYVKVKSYDVSRDAESSDDGICDSSGSAPYVIANGDVNAQCNCGNMNNEKCDCIGTSAHRKPDTLGILKVTRRPPSDYVKQLPPQYFSEIDNIDDLPTTEL